MAVGRFCKDFRHPGQRNGALSCLSECGIRRQHRWCFACSMILDPYERMTGIDCVRFSDTSAAGRAHERPRFVSLSVLAVCGRVRRMKRTMAALMTAWIMIVVAGCARSPEAQKAKYLERADGFFSRKAYDRAVPEYLNVPRLDPENRQ